MTVADANQTSLAWIDEVTFGVPPAAPATHQRMRYTSETMGKNREVITSDEIDVDRQTIDQLNAAEEAGGDVNIELSHGAHDDWLQKLLLSGAYAGAVADLGSTKEVLIDTPSPGQTTFRLAAGDWGASGFLPNQHALMTGFDPPASPGAVSNNGVWSILTAGTTDLVCRGVGVAEAAAARSVVQLEQVVTGTTLQSMTIERENENIPVEADRLSQLLGMTIQQLTLESVKRDRVRGTFTMLGKDEQTIATSDADVKTAVTTNRVYSVTADLDTFLINNDRSSKMTAFRFTYANGLYIIDNAGELTPDNIGIGEAQGSGSVEYYYENPSTFTFFESFADIPLLIAFTNAGGTIAFEFVRNNLSNGRRNAAGKSQAVVATHDFLSSKDAAQAITLRISRT